VLGRSVTVSTESGTVLIRRPGERTATPLTADATIPVGSLIDATKGRVALTSADRRGLTQTASFYAGSFTVRQPKAAKGRTDLILPRLTCRGSEAAAALRKRRKRRLWGSGSGAFRTDGRYGAATVTGTQWLTEERCSGTFVLVRTGTVSVRDKVRRRTVKLKAGGSYLARPAR